MKPTQQTRWFFIQARTEGASCAACLRAKAFGLARCHADRAREFWHMVQWERE